MRTYYAWYWTMLDLPGWWRSSEVGWWDLAFTPISDCEGIRGGLTALTDRLLTEMDFPMHIALPARLGPPLSLDLSFGSFMADAKALQQMWCVKTLALTGHVFVAGPLLVDADHRPGRIFSTSLKKTQASGMSGRPTTDTTQLRS